MCGVVRLKGLLRVLMTSEDGARDILQGSSSVRFLFSNKVQQPRDSHREKRPGVPVLKGFIIL